MKIRFLIAVVLGVFATFSTIVAQTISQTNAQPQSATNLYQSALKVQEQATKLNPTAAVRGTRTQSPLPPRGYYPAAAPGTSYAPQTQQSNFFSVARDAVQPKVDAKLREYKKSKSSADKSKLKDELKELLESQFDERLKRPVAAIENSRKRLAQLSEQHKSREKKSREIVSLRLKVIINEADGLGWRGGQSGNYFTTLGGNAYPVQWGQTNITGTYTALAPVQVSGIRSTQARLPSPPQLPAVVQGTVAPNRKSVNLDANAPKSQHSLLADYKEAKDESKRGEILDELTALLKKEFQAHQEQIQKQIDGIETQISDLEVNIEKRKEAKEEIVELKLQTLINQANGLGF